MVAITSAGVSGLFLLLRRWQLTRNAPADERTTRLVLRSFVWANRILMGGIIVYLCYWFYLRLTGHANTSDGHLVFALPIILSLATMWATYLRHKLPGHDVLYWLTIVQFACFFPAKLLTDFVDHGLVALILNPSWIFLAFVVHMSILVIRNGQRNQEGSTDE